MHLKCLVFRKLFNRCAVSLSRVMLDKQIILYVADVGIVKCIVKIDCQIPACTQGLPKIWIIELDPHTYIPLGRQWDRLWILIIARGGGHLEELPLHVILQISNFQQCKMKNYNSTKDSQTATSKGFVGALTRIVETHWFSKPVKIYKFGFKCIPNTRLILLFRHSII